MKNILYIDDNKHNLELMKLVVHSIAPECEVLCVSQYREFLEKAGEHIDYYIIDFTLDDILGDELYEKLLQIHDSPDTIFISAGSIEDLKSRFEKFSVKPFAITDRFGAIDVLKRVKSRERIIDYNLQEAAEILSISNLSLIKHIDSFYREFCNESERIKKILSGRDYDKIYFEFHKLKSTFKMISAENIVSLCQDACNSAIENIEKPYEIIFQEITVLFEKIIIMIKEQK